MIREYNDGNSMHVINVFLLTMQEAEESVKLHHLQRRKTFENLHVEELASEGEKIRERMHSPSKELLQDNPDFSATLDTVDVLMSRVESVRSRLEKLWYERNEKLEANLKKKKFEHEAKQVSERWCVCASVGVCVCMCL